MPIYKCVSTVLDEKGGTSTTRLVEAANVAAARNFIARDVIKVEVASSSECVSLGADGVKLEKA
jgi:hypothetical protein